MPRLGEPVWVALTMSGLPDLRLPARAVRESAGPDGTPRAAVRFSIPSNRVSGLELLLLQRLQEQNGQGIVLVIESDLIAREHMLKIVRQGGELCVGVGSAEEVNRIAGWLRVDTLLTRAHPEALDALKVVSARLPNARRAILGSNDAAHLMRARGLVDVVLGDAAGAPGLHKAVRGFRARPDARRTK